MYERISECLMDIKPPNNQLKAGTVTIGRETEARICGADLSVVTYFVAQSPGSLLSSETLIFPRPSFKFGVMLGAESISQKAFSFWWMSSLLDYGASSVFTQPPQLKQKGCVGRVWKWCSFWSTLHCPGWGGARNPTLRVVLWGRPGILALIMILQGVGLLRFAPGDSLGSVYQHCSWQGWKTCLTAWNYLVTMLISTFSLLLQV